MTFYFVKVLLSELRCRRDAGATRLFVPVLGNIFLEGSIVHCSYLLNAHGASLLMGNLERR
jgi:hypothetical protein